MLQRFKDWASFLRDVGLIIGMPTVVVVGIQLYELQVDALEQQKAIIEERNKLLQETQYDRALDIIRAQKELFDLERQQLEAQLASARQGTEQDKEKIAGLESKLNELKSVTKALGQFNVTTSDEGRVLISTPVGTIGIRG